jgi:Rrf2 family transcriptional regulator, nitric oxide-sensitive transcriptional repressor
LQLVCWLIAVWEEFLKLNRKVEFALIALRHMQGKKPAALTSVKEIAELYGCSFDMTSRVLQKLAQAQIVKAVHGAQGGYQICCDLKEVSFYQLNSLLTEPLAIARCLQHQTSSENCEIRKQCNIISPVQKLNNRLKEFYQGLRLSELVSSSSNLQQSLEV